MNIQVPVLVLVSVAVAAVARGGTIVHMDRKDSDDGKVRPESMIYAQDGQFRRDTLDAAGHVRDFVLVRDGNIWQVDMEKRTFMQIDRAALSGKQNEMQDRMQAMLQSLPPEKRAAMEARVQGMMAGRSQPAFTMTDTGKTDQVGSWSCEIWQVRRGGTVSSDACIASRGSLQGSSIIVGNPKADTLRAWSTAWPKEGPMLGIAHVLPGMPASQPISVSNSSRVT